MNPYLFYYLAVVNLIAFIVSGYDKLAAIHRKHRIPEKILFLIAATGGSMGLFLSMLLFRHKTRHWYFMAGVPLIMIMQAAILHYFGQFG